MQRQRLHVETVSDSDDDSSSYDLLPAPSVASAASTMTTTEETLRMLSPNTIQTMLKMSRARDGLDSNEVDPALTMNSSSEILRLNNAVTEKDQEIARLRQEIEHNRQGSHEKRDASPAQDDVGDATERLKENTILENRARFFKCVDQYEKDSDSMASIEQQTYFIMLAHLLATLMMFYHFHISKREDNRLILPAGMAFLSFGTVFLVYFSEGAGTAVRKHHRLITQILLFALDCLWMVNSSLQFHYALMALKCTLIMFSSWRISVESGQRVQWLKRLAEEAAGYHHLRAASTATTAAAAGGDDQEVTAVAAATGNIEEQLAADAASAPETSFFVELDRLEFVVDKNESISAYPYVFVVIPGGSAERSGLVKSGHEILSINGVSLENATVAYACDLGTKLKENARLELRFNPRLVHEF